MQTTYKVITNIIDIGPVILIPSILFLAGLITIRNPLKTLKNSIFVFIGFMGVSILLTIFVNFFEPIINTIIINSPKKFEVLDVGWLVSEKVTLTSPIIFHIIIAVALLNLIMILLRLTRTINIDFWNYWSFLLVGSIIFAITEIQWMGILTSLVIASITLVMADVYAPFIETYFGVKGISNPQAHIICWAPISHLVNFILNKIPFVKKIHLFFEEIRYKLGILSEPMIIGFILGFIVGIITKYKNFTLNIGTNILFALASGFKLSIIMILLPRMVNLLFKGLIPILEGIRNFISTKITKREIYIGLDSIIFVGYPSVIGLSAIMIPLTLYIATKLPANSLLPAADLIIIPFILIWAIAPSKGDIFRSFISSLIIIPIVLLITTDMAELFTGFFQKYGLELVEGYNKISSIGAGSNIFFWILLQVIKPILKLFL